MKINCLSCGHKVDIDDAYDDYEGQVKCFVCGAILLISTTDGALKSVKAVSGAVHASAAKAFRVTQ